MDLKTYQTHFLSSKLKDQCCRQENIFRLINLFSLKSAHDKINWKLIFLPAGEMHYLVAFVRTMSLKLATLFQLNVPQARLQNNRANSVHINGHRPRTMHAIWAESGCTKLPSNCSLTIIVKGRKKKHKSENRKTRRIEGDKREKI